MARPGGNPILEHHQFKAAGKESNNARISFWAPQSIKTRLDKLGAGKAEFLRQAIAKALDELD